MIYFTQDSGTLNIKIGYTGGTAEERRRALQTGNSSALVVLAEMAGTEDDERTLHARFASARVAGEWFKPVPDLLRLIVAHNYIPPPAPRNAPAFLAPDFAGLICPSCGCECIHCCGAYTAIGCDASESETWEPYPGTDALGLSDWRRNTLQCHFYCEYGCRFSINFKQHKGTTFIDWRRLPDDHTGYAGDDAPDDYHFLLAHDRELAQRRLAEHHASNRERAILSGEAAP